MTYETTTGEIWEVEYNYEPEEASTYWFHGAAAIIEIISVTDEDGNEVVDYDVDAVEDACWVDVKNIKKYI